MWMFAYSVHVLSSWHDTSKKTFLGKQGKKTKVALDPIRLILSLVSVLYKILYTCLPGRVGNSLIVFCERKS